MKTVTANNKITIKLSMRITCKDTLQIKMKSKGQKKIYHNNAEQKKAGKAVVTSDKADS